MNNDAAIELQLLLLKNGAQLKDAGKVTITVPDFVPDDWTIDEA